MKISLSQIPWLVCLVLVGALAFYFWKEQRATEALLKVKNEELMQANLEIGRAHTKIVDQEKVHKTALANIQAMWKNEIEARKALVVAYGELEALYKAEKKKVKTITKIVYQDKEVDIPQGKIFYLNDNNEYIPVTSMTYTYRDFRIDIQGDAIQETLSYQLHQKFKAQFIATKTPSGADNHYAKIYEVDETGKEVAEMELSSFEVIKAEDLPNQFMWFNPKLDLLLGGSVNSNFDGSVVGEIGFSLMSYGKTEDDIVWRFVRLGTGITNHGFSLTGSPAQLNLGKFLPLISNFWFTPFAGYDFGATAGQVGAGFSVVF